MCRELFSSYNFVFGAMNARATNLSSVHISLKHIKYYDINKFLDDTHTILENKWTYSIEYMHLGSAENLFEEREKLTYTAME